MGEEFSFENVTTHIKRLQKQGWEIMEIEEKRFRFGFEGRITYRRSYNNLENLTPMNDLFFRTPEIDLQAEYFSRLYQIHWQSRSKKKLIAL